MDAPYQMEETLRPIYMPTSQSLLLLLMAGCSTRAHSCVIDQRGSPYIARYYDDGCCNNWTSLFPPFDSFSNAFSAFVLINPGTVLCTREEKKTKKFLFFLFLLSVWLWTTAHQHVNRAVFSLWIYCARAKIYRLGRSLIYLSFNLLYTLALGWPYLERERDSAKTPNAHLWCREVPGRETVRCLALRMIGRDLDNII